MKMMKKSLTLTEEQEKYIENVQNFRKLKATNESTGNELEGVFEFSLEKLTINVKKYIATRGMSFHVFSILSGICGFFGPIFYDEKSGIYGFQDTIYKLLEKDPDPEVREAVEKKKAYELNEDILEDIWTKLLKSKDWLCYMTVWEEAKKYGREDYVKKALEARLLVEKEKAYIETFNLPIARKSESKSIHFNPKGYRGYDGSYRLEQIYKKAKEDGYNDIAKKTLETWLSIEKKYTLREYSFFHPILGKIYKIAKEDGYNDIIRQALKVRLLVSVTGKELIYKIAKEDGYNDIAKEILEEWLSEAVTRRELRKIRLRAEKDGYNDIVNKVLEKLKN